MKTSIPIYPSSIL